MLNIERNQTALLGQDNVVTRKHNIPADLYAYAVGIKSSISTPAGRGNKNLPTLPDIYASLINEGIDLVFEGTVIPEFTEIGKDVARSCQIRFVPDLQKELLEIKRRADAGEWKVSPYRQISLMSVAVNLMQIAVAERNKSQRYMAKLQDAYPHKKSLNS